MTTSIRRAFYHSGFEIRSTDVVVDVGCGDGDAVVFAGNLGAEVIATDCDPLVLARVEERMRDVPARSFRAILSDSNPIPLPDASADVVICTEVAEHVPDPPRFLAELARIGKPGARYLISVPDPRSESLMKNVAPEWYWRPPYHLHIYQPDQLDALLRSVGIYVESRQSMGFYWTMWWLLRMSMAPKPLEPMPTDGPTVHWDAVWTTLGQTEHGCQLAHALDQALPKSQIRLARKAEAAHTSPSSFQGPSFRWAGWRRRLRDGSLRVGGVRLNWQVRRESPRAESGA